MPRILSDADVADFRARLCAAAEDQFAEHGIEAVTMRQLAAALGVSPMTPYRYFRDKDEIIDAVRTSAYDRFADALEAAFDAHDDPAERSVAVGEAYLDFAVNNPRAYALMFDLKDMKTPPSEGLLAAGRRARDCQVRHVQGLIDAGLITGNARRRHPRQCATDSAMNEVNARTYPRRQAQATLQAHVYKNLGRQS